MSKDNTGKNKEDNSGIQTQKDVNREDNLGTGVDLNGGIGVDNLSTNNIDAEANGRKKVDNLDIGTDIDIKAVNSNITTA